MKNKMLIAGVATLSVMALFGCQQTDDQTAAPSNTGTSTTNVMVPAQTQVTTNMSLSIVAPQTQQSSATTTLDGVMMKSGKMMVTKGGKTTTMTQTMTMSNGTKVMTSGKVIMKTGKTSMMKNGDAMMMNGTMTTADKMMVPANSMMTGSSSQQ